MIQDNLQEELQFREVRLEKGVQELMCQKRGAALDRQWDEPSRERGPEIPKNRPIHSG